MTPKDPEDLITHSSVEAARGTSPSEANPPPGSPAAKEEADRRLEKALARAPWSGEADLGTRDGIQLARERERLGKEAVEREILEADRDKAKEAAQAEGASQKLNRVERSVFMGILLSIMALGAAVAITGLIRGDSWMVTAAGLLLSGASGGATMGLRRARAASDEKPPSPEGVN